MNDNNQNATIVIQPTNTDAVIGFVFALLGFVTCGVLSVPGFIFSYIGSKKEPKGLAVAGLILSAPGVLWFAFCALQWLGFGAFAAFH